MRPGFALVQAGLSSRSVVVPCAAELAENLEADYKKHEAEDLRVPPEELAESHVSEVTRPLGLAGPVVGLAQEAGWSIGPRCIPGTTP